MTAPRLAAAAPRQPLRIIKVEIDSVEDRSGSKRKIIVVGWPGPPTAPASRSWPATVLIVAGASGR
jgi:hypothetical protein